MNHDDGFEVVGDNDVTVGNLCRIKMTLLDIRNSYNNSRLRASDIQIYFDLNTNEVEVKGNLSQIIGVITLTVASLLRMIIIWNSDKL